MVCSVYNYKIVLAIALEITTCKIKLEYFEDLIKLETDVVILHIKYCILQHLHLSKSKIQYH